MPPQTNAELKTGALWGIIKTEDFSFRKEVLI